MSRENKRKTQGANRATAVTRSTKDPGPPPSKQQRNVSPGKEDGAATMELEEGEVARTLQLDVVANSQGESPTASTDPADTATSDHTGPATDELAAGSAADSDTSHRSEELDDDGEPAAQIRIRVVNYSAQHLTDPALYEELDAAMDELGTHDLDAPTRFNSGANRHTGSVYTYESLNDVGERVLRRSGFLYRGQKLRVSREATEVADRACVYWAAGTKAERDAPTLSPDDRNKYLKERAVDYAALCESLGYKRMNDLPSTADDEPHGPCVDFPPAGRQPLMVGSNLAWLISFSYIDATTAVAVAERMNTLGLRDGKDDLINWKVGGACKVEDHSAWHRENRLIGTGLGEEVETAIKEARRIKLQLHSSFKNWSEVQFLSAWSRNSTALPVPASSVSHIFFVRKNKFTCAYFSVDTAEECSKLVALRYISLAAHVMFLSVAVSQDTTAENAASAVQQREVARNSRRQQQRERAKPNGGGGARPTTYAAAAAATAPDPRLAAMERKVDSITSKIDQGIRESSRAATAAREARDAVSLSTEANLNRADNLEKTVVSSIENHSSSWKEGHDKMAAILEQMRGNAKEKATPISRMTQGLQWDAMSSATREQFQTFCKLAKEQQEKEKGSQNKKK